MKKLVMIWIVLLVSACNATEFWNTNSQKVSLYNDLSLNLVEEFRLSNNSDIFIQYAGISYPVNKNWSIAGWYKYVLINSTDYNSNRIVLDANFKKGFISNRFRFENILESDDWIYRNRITLFTNIGKVKPFVSGEFFIPCESNEIVENRLKGGIGFAINKKINLSVSYMLREKRKITTDVVCLSTSIKF